MRSLVVATSLMLAAPLAVPAQVSVQIGVPGVGIGIQVPAFPTLVQIPGYPVYYAPSVNGNYFFYDGMYYVLQGDVWYSSAWYDGPWTAVPPQVVPAFVLRVPVRYYRAPPPWFRGWRADGPPRWGEHWGADWERQRQGWDRWNRAATPAPAPLPVYQREYAGKRYPEPRLQPSLHDRNYGYWPRDAEVRKAYVANGMHGGPAPQARGAPAGGRGQPANGQGNGRGQGRGHEQGHGQGEGHGHGHE